MTLTTEASTSISRRKVVVGAAWSVPAIVAAGSAPAFAASSTWTAALVSLQVAPAAGTGAGNQGTQANLATNQTFNTFVTVRNAGPDVAPQMRVQVTFDQVANPEEFAANTGWAVELVAVNTNLNRWLVTFVYAAPVAANATAPQLIVTTRTRLASAFPTGQSGAYEVLARTYDSTGAVVPATLSDYFYVTR